MASLRIPVAEDLDEDIELLKRAFSTVGVNVPLHFVTDGQQAIDYLKGEGAFANRAQHPLPTVMLLDLKMPVLGGFEVLEWLRVQPVLRLLVVVVFTSSADQEDIQRGYELGANSYLVKPSSFDKLLEIVRTLQDYWLSNNLSPDLLPPPTTAVLPARVTQSFQPERRS
jgi:CheY-like chemotaxis protein